MPNRFRVMSWLEGLTQDNWRQYHSDSEVQEIARRALALLKEQEPVTPRWTHPTVNTNVMMCGSCGIEIPLGRPNYCPWCGRKIKW